MRIKSLLFVGIASFAIATPAAAQYFDGAHDHSAHGQQVQAAPAARAAAPSAPPPAQLADTQWQTELGFEPEMFRSHVAFLAHDMLEGRDAGSRGYDLAAHYVATQFQGLGLTPGYNGSWYQQVPFTRIKGSSGRLTVGGRNFSVGQDLVYVPGIAEQPFAMDAQAVFAGHGVVDAAAGRDDLAGLDLAGKIIVIMAAQGANPQAGIMAAGKRGAVGAVIIRPAAAAAAAPLSKIGVTSAGATRLVEGASAASPAAAGPMGSLRFVALADTPLLEAMFANAPRSLAQVAADYEAKRPVRGFAFAPKVRAERTLEQDPFTSPNVVAIIPGSDPALANEYVLLSAHLDHVGIHGEATGQRNADGAGADRIYNGAMDNATGIATLLEVARKFMEPGNRPKRSILIAAVTAEEDGLLGSKHLARNPVVPGRIVANVNLDMPILTYAFQDVVAFGAEHSSLGPIVERAARSMNVALIPDPLPDEKLFTRSDHYSFVQVGIPAVFLMTGFGGEGEKRFKGFLANEYHSPKDDLSLPFDWRTGARFAELNYRIAREIANAPQAPRWYQGSEFAPKDAQTVPRPRN